jgi:hypothetical protein
MEGFAREEHVVVEIRAREPAVRPWQMEEGSLTPRVHEDDRRRGGHGLILRNATAVDAALVEELEDEVAEGVDSHLPHDCRLQTEPD